MFKKMWKRAAQQADVWGRQWSLHSRGVFGTLSTRISSHLCCRSQSRQQSVSMVRPSPIATPCSPTCASHRLCEDQQRSGELDTTLSNLSWGYARVFNATGELEEDLVESIEFFGEVDHTYNLEVQGTHNFFANGILTHNCDDPHGAQDAQSDTMRNSTLEWLDMVWSSRKNDPRTSCSVVIMQRLHDDDATGHLLKQGGYEHLCLPAEYDGIRRKTTLGEYDPRTTQGELLWPNRFGKKELETLKTALGAYGASGQLQQQPSPEGGGILKTDHVQLWPADRELPQFLFILQSYDTAFSEKTTGDPTGCITFGVFNYKEKQNVLVLDCWTEHLGYPELKERVMDDWKSSYGANKDDAYSKGRRPDIILVEAKASGQSLLQDLRMSNIPAQGYNPGRADKVQRAHLMAPVLETDCIWVMESKKQPRTPISWARPMLENWAKFPVVSHDELTDAASQAIIYFKDAGWLDTAYHEDDIDPEYADDTRTKGNPYAA